MTKAEIAKPIAEAFNHLPLLVGEKIEIKTKVMTKIKSAATHADRVCDKKIDTINKSKEKAARYFQILLLWCKTNKQKGINSICAEPNKFLFAIKPYGIKFPGNSVKAVP